MLNLVYVHIGKVLPECFLDTIYQSILTNYNKVKIYILVDDELINDLKDSVLKLNKIYLKSDTEINFDLQFTFIKNSLLERHLHNQSTTLYALYTKYINTLQRFELNFRSNFWISTSKRFYYILALIDIFDLKDVFHIENDIMLYEDLNKVYKSLSDVTKMNVVKDSHSRVIPSIIFIPDYNSLLNLVTFMSDTLDRSSEFINDMTLLGNYTNTKDGLNSVNTFNIFPKKEMKYVFDGAAIGQYLEGVDIKNLKGLPDDTESQQYKIIKFNNPSRGFINETSDYKPNTSIFYYKLCHVSHLKVPMYVLLVGPKEGDNYHSIVSNIHIHSKQLYKFNSLFNLKIDDIISGDKVVSLCDFVISTSQINAYHVNIDKFIKPDKIILIKDLNNVNYNALNAYLKTSGKKIIKLFIYTHMLNTLLEINFFEKINSTFEYIIYLHNSDHTFDDSYNKLLKYTHIKFVYAQNPNCAVENNSEGESKVKLLPIGLANSMWPHGNMIEFYDIVRSIYMFDKTKTIYININPKTYSYRQIVLDKLHEYECELSGSKPYKDYLIELSQHYFCLCVRGNGIDTHRFWESLYLGVIPVIINNNETNCQNYINYLNKLEIPFYEVTNLELFQNKDFFNKSLYNKIISRLNNSIQNISSLKMSYYIYN